MSGVADLLPAIPAVAGNAAAVGARIKTVRKRQIDSGPLPNFLHWTITFIAALMIASKKSILVHFIIYFTYLTRCDWEVWGSALTRIPLQGKKLKHMLKIYLGSAK